MMAKFRFRLAALALSLISLPVSGTASAAPAAKPRDVVMLVQQDGPNIAVDEKVRAHLAERGYAVRFENQDADPATARGAALVIVSSTVSSKDVKPGWRALAVPLLSWENDILDDLAMTGKRHDVDFGEVEKERYLWIVNAPQSMAAGVPAGVANVYVKQAGMSWGKPGLGATTIATIYGQLEKAAIFGYEKGATMDYEAIAPARRVMMFLNNDTFANLSPAGLRLFDAAVDWAADGTR